VLASVVTDGLSNTSRGQDWGCAVYPVAKECQSSTRPG